MSTPKTPVDLTKCTTP